MKKAIFIILLLFLSFNFVSAKEKLEINFFYSPTCGHCKEEHKFLDDLQEKYQDIKINKFEISKNTNLLKSFYQKYKVPRAEWGLVPITFTRENYFLGFNQKIAKKIKSCVESCLSGEKDNNLPINESKYSLLVLAAILGFLDGFNICSLGALIFILTLVLSLKSRKKTLIFGGLFILTTSIIYGFLMVLWYKIFAFVSGYLRGLEILIAFVGIIGGIYFLREFIRFKKYGAVCKIGTSQKIMVRASGKLKNLFEGKSIILVILAILLFAGIITIVEFPCSAVVPVAFAGILAKANLSATAYLAYIVIFIFFYMLDEIFVFAIAFITAKIWFAQNKSLTVWLTLAQAIILFLLGFYYLFI